MLKLGRVPRELLFLGGAVVLILGTLPLASLVKYTTSTPSFCLSCHSQGFAKVTFNSQVHPTSVGCTSCHSRGKGLLPLGFPQSFSADDEVINPNCLRCHKEVAKEKLPQFKFNPLQINIPHERHLKMGLNCTDCHRNVVHDKRFEPTNRPAMNTCQACHQQTKEVASCATCHKGVIPASPSLTAVPVGS